MSISFRELRIALAHLAEEPPIWLGDTDLARELWPDEQDRRTRGTWLQQALHTAIDSLRPCKIEVTPNDARCWSYLVCVHEYANNRLRKEVQPELALSDGAYSRAKRRALERINDMLPYVVADMDARNQRAVGG